MYNYKHPFNFTFTDSMEFLDGKHLRLLCNKGALEFTTMLKVLKYIFNAKVSVAFGTK